MSEIINNNEQRINQLKEMFRKINDGENPENIKSELSNLMKEIPYDDVIAAEQELIEEGVEQEKMLELCDLHTNALKGIINNSNERKVSAAHPVDTFKKENLALQREISLIKFQINKIEKMNDEENCGDLIIKINSHFNTLMDVEKHYLRKEYLLFPFLEKYKITGPPTVMWGKHDQTRELLKSASEVLRASHEINSGEAKLIFEISLLPAIKAVEEMIYKEENILFPMCLDTLKEEDWFEIYKQSDEYGFCIYEPKENWQPENSELISLEEKIDATKIQLPTGFFKLQELISVFNTMPFDLTFVDKDDKVKFFSEGKDRIFQRGKAIIGRKVQFCHPPSSVHTVEKILNDFKTGVQDKASFWINMREKFIYISYYAVRDENTKEYLGTLEVTQDLTELRKLEGERRILSYEN